MARRPSGKTKPSGSRANAARLGGMTSPRGEGTAETQYMNRAKGVTAGRREQYKGSNVVVNTRHLGTDNPKIRPGKQKPAATEAYTRVVRNPKNLRATVISGSRQTGSVKPTKPRSRAR